MAEITTSWGPCPWLEDGDVVLMEGVEEKSKAELCDRDLHRAMGYPDPGATVVCVDTFKMREIHVSNEDLERAGWTPPDPRSWAERWVDALAYKVLEKGWYEPWNSEIK